MKKKTRSRIIAFAIVVFIITVAVVAAIVADMGIAVGISWRI